MKKIDRAKIINLNYPRTFVLASVKKLRRKKSRLVITAFKSAMILRYGVSSLEKVRVASFEISSFAELFPHRISNHPLHPSAPSLPPSSPSSRSIAAVVHIHMGVGGPEYVSSLPPPFTLFSRGSKFTDRYIFREKRDD